MPEIRSVALMVCTYRRPTSFRAFVGSVCRLTLPEGLRLTLVVADNNPESAFEHYIGACLEACPYPSRYGHEPVPGYANARNLALKLALETDAEILAFVDDDMLLEPDWLEGQVRSYRELDCDGVSGTIVGHPAKHRHGERRPVTGMGNTSFKRSWVAPDGLALAFDARFNEMGYEDQAFTRAASEAGMVIRHSELTRIVDPAAIGSDWQAEQMNRALIAAVTRRNQVVALRREKGYLPAVASALASLRYGAKSAGLTGQRLALNALRDGNGAARARISAWKEWRKMVESFRGLAGNPIPRRDVRRNDDPSLGA